VGKAANGIATGNREAVEDTARALAAHALHDVERAAAVDGGHGRATRARHRYRLPDEVDRLEVRSGRDLDQVAVGCGIDARLNRRLI
jgi:hypothetical protein